MVIHPLIDFEFIGTKGFKSNSKESKEIEKLTRKKQNSRECKNSIFSLDIKE